MKIIWGKGDKGAKTEGENCVVQKVIKKLKINFLILLMIKAQRCFSIILFSHFFYSISNHRMPQKNGMRRRKKALNSTLNNDAMKLIQHNRGKLLFAKKITKKNCVQWRDFRMLCKKAEKMKLNPNWHCYPYPRRFR